MAASEQTKIEFAAPNYLRNIVVILSEMGLRYKKELLPMKKEQVDLENGIVHIADSKTVNGIGDMPMTSAAQEAFQRQIEQTPGSEYLFPSPKQTATKPHITNLPQGLGGNAEEGRLAVLRALRVAAYLRDSAECGRRRRSHGDADASAGGHAEVFTLYSQAQLGMMREALAKLDRQANERPGNLFTERPS